MLIGKDWKIESNKLNVVLYRRSDAGHHSAKTDGAIMWQVQGYYSTIKDALRGLADQGIRDTDLLEFKAIVDKQNDIYAIIDNLTLAVSA